MRLLGPMGTALICLILAGLGAPLPEELPTLGAGVWVATQKELGPARWFILPVCFVGVVLGDLCLYSMGRFWGTRLLELGWVKRVLPAERRLRIEENFRHYGIKVLLAIRWLPAIRSPMFITAGMMRVPIVEFLIADGLAAVLGHTVLFFLAYWFSDQFTEDQIAEQAKTVVMTLKPYLIQGIIIAVAVYFLVRYLRRPVSNADPAEFPLVGEQVAATMDHLENKGKETIVLDSAREEITPISKSELLEPPNP